MGVLRYPFFLMATISYGASTELDAVNSILMSVGESPVNTISDPQSPEVAIAQSTLRQVCREVQAEGWVFNTEHEYPITLDSSKHCLVPVNVLEIDLSHARHGDHFNVVRKNDNGVTKLYDKVEHRYNFDNVNENKLYCDILWMIDFEDLPQVFKDYITIRASRIASNRMVSDPKAAELIGTDEALARALAVEYDTRVADHNIFSNQEYRTNPASVYRPYQVINR